MIQTSITQHDDSGLMEAWLLVQAWNFCPPYHIMYAIRLSGQWPLGLSVKCLVTPSLKFVGDNVFQFQKAVTCIFDMCSLSWLDSYLVIFSTFQIPVFYQFRKWKAFHVWRENVRAKNIIAARRALEENLFFLNAVCVKVIFIWLLLVVTQEVMGHHYTTVHLFGLSV